MHDKCKQTQNTVNIDHIQWEYIIFPSRPSQLQSDTCRDIQSVIVLLNIMANCNDLQAPDTSEYRCKNKIELVFKKGRTLK